MRVGAASLVLLGVTVTARRQEIVKRQGDYFLRLQNQGGNLVLDEGKITLYCHPVFHPSCCRRCHPERIATEGPQHVCQEEEDCTR